jgi:hypothetical protein
MCVCMNMSAMYTCRSMYVIGACVLVSVCEWICSLDKLCGAESIILIAQPMKIFPPLMETECSLPLPQEAGTGP